MKKTGKSAVSVPTINQKLSKDERCARSFIEVGFQPHNGAWMDTAKRLLNGFNGQYFTKAVAYDRFTVNSIFSLVNLLLPNLIFNSPYISAKPKQARYFKKLPDGEQIQIDNNKAAQIREATLNHCYKKIGAYYEQRKAVQDSFFFGFGIVKVGYSFETITQEDKDYIVKDTVFLKRVNPRDFGWHPLATGLDDSRYLVHRVLTTKSSLTDNKRYKVADIDKIECELPDYLQEKYNRHGGVYKEAKDEDFITLYEVHDQERDKIYIFGGESKILLEKKDREYKFNGPDFSMIRFSSDNENFEGIPLLAPVEDQIEALNEVFTLIIQHFRKFPGQMFYNKGSMDDNDVQRIINGEQGSLHAIPDVTQLKTTPPLSMGPDYFNIIQLMNNLMDRVLGIPDFQRLTSTTRKSATEASFIQGDASIRRQYFLTLVKEFMLDGIDKMGALQAQFQDEEEEIQATGQLQGMIINYNKEDIQGEFQLDFDVEELTAFNQAQMSGLTALLNVLASNQILHPVLRTLDPEKIGKILFRAIGRNLESLQSGDIETAVFVRPEKENEAARKGEPMPAPKRGEDHAYHIKIHSEDLIKKGPSEPILEHIAMTIMLQQKEEMEKKGALPGTPQPDAMAGMIPGAEGMMAAGPTGPEGSGQEVPGEAGMPQAMGL